MIIDTHVHVFPDHIAAKALATMEQHSGIKLATDGTLASLKQSMAIAGITHAVNLPVSTSPEQAQTINRHAISTREPGIIPFGSLHPNLPSFRDEIKRLVDSGIRGIKMHPDIQAFYVDDKALFTMYESIAEAGLLLFLHAGKNIDLPDPAHCTPERLARVIDHNPNLKVITAHLGGWRLWDDVERHLVGRSLWMDTSFAVGHLPQKQFMRIIRNHGVEKILFGTDSPWLNQKAAIDELTRLPLSRDEKRAIFSDNACSLLGIQV